MPNFPEKLIIGSRGSPLALAQVQEVVDRLKSKHPQIKIEIRKIKTSGDLLKTESIGESGGKGLFVKEIEEELLHGQIDLAVHSLKDVPAIIPDPLKIAFYLPRADARDCLVSRKFRDFDSLPYGASVGTSSPRRICQIKFFRRDLRIKPIRGNVETRIKKMEAGEFDAIILAVAGLIRLGKEKAITQYFNPVSFIPAVGQGILALEIRKNQPDLENFLKEIFFDPNAEAVALAERAFLQKIGGDCYTPLGAYAWVDKETVLMCAFLGSLDGMDLFRLVRYTKKEEAVSLGEGMAHSLLQQGGDKILHAISSDKASKTK